MLDQLSHPKLGYEEVISGHFYLLKDKIYKIIESWISDPNASSGHSSRLKSLLGQLKAKISALPVPKEKPEED